MPKVITHKGAQHKTVDLCKHHEDADTIARHIGTDYHGVSQGLHRGDCQECVARELALERFDAEDQE